MKIDNHIQICHFEPVDTWFFREARPMTNIDNSELTSVFPPPVSTLMGALRTAIGNLWLEKNPGNSWNNFDNLNDLQKIIGNSHNLGELSCQGLFLTFNNKRLYPLPSSIMCKKDNNDKEIYFEMMVNKNDAIECDLGKVYLAEFPEKVEELENTEGAKNKSNAWVKEDGFKRILCGEKITDDDIIQSDQLFQGEPRLGIGINNSQRSVEKGLLYQTKHLRIKENVGVELWVAGLPEDSTNLLPNNEFVRLGGEGRMASLSIKNPPTKDHIIPFIKELETTDSYIKIYINTAMACKNKVAGIPDNFIKIEGEKCDFWEGNILGHTIRIYSVIANKSVREGGWDLASNQAKAVKSYLAPGSVLFAEIVDKDNCKKIINALHGAFIDSTTGWGRGQIFIGKWKQNQAA